MTTEQWLVKAETYFNGEMSAAEAELFENETAASKELMQLMQLWKRVDAEAALYEQSEEEATSLITTHQKLKHDFFEEHVAYEFSSKKKETVKHRRKIEFSVWQWMTVAAILAGIIISTELLITSPGKKTPVVQTTPKPGDSNMVSDSRSKAPPNKDSETVIKVPDKNEPAVLYAQVFLPDEVPEDSDGPLDDAFFYYASAQYEKAITAIDNARDKPATRGNNAFTPLTDFYASYYKALSLMSLGNTTKAIPLLKNALEQSPAETLTIKVEWYLSLAYLKEEKIAPATETLKILINHSGVGEYKSKAEKLLAKINS